MDYVASPAARQIIDKDRPGPYVACLMTEPLRAAGNDGMILAVARGLGCRRRRLRATARRRIGLHLPTSREGGLGWTEGRNDRSEPAPGPGPGAGRRAGPRCPRRLPPP